MLVALVFLQVLLVTMVYGPIAVFLVELFPTRIRYTSMSLPYHTGNGVFGGLTPYVASLLVERTGNAYAGLAYPIAIAETVPGTCREVPCTRRHVPGTTPAGPWLFARLCPPITPNPCLTRARRCQASDGTRQAS
jgi:hypothetical protein